LARLSPLELRLERLKHRAIGDVHTNTIEGVFANLKTGMRGAYKHVSHRRLPSYLDEYSFRYSERHNGAIFRTMIDKAAQS
jgi:hypothetical protein